MPDLSITNRGHLLNADQADATARLKNACHQFEQVFVEMILKRDDLEENPLVDGDSASQQFRSLLNSGLSEQAAGSLGVSDILMHELGARAALSGPPSASAPRGVSP